MKLKLFGAFAGLFLSAGYALANVVELTWTTTVLAAHSGFPAIVGETLTTTIRVDNGGSSVSAQTWSVSDFLSFRQEGASGWFLESTDINPFFSFGVFSTDATGVVLTAGSWVDDWPTGPVNTSWAGATLGGWWNNGNNATSCVAFDCVFAANVEANLIGASWTASIAGLPEPATLALLGLGLAGLGFARRRK